MGLAQSPVMRRERGFIPTVILSRFPPLGLRERRHAARMSRIISYFIDGDRIIFYGAGTPTCALMARREVFRELGGFDATLKRVEDVDFAIRLALAGGCFIGTAENLFLQHSTQGSDKSPDANRSAEIAVAKKHEGYLRSVGRYHYASHWPNLRYYHFKRQYLRFIAQFFLIAVRNPILATSHLLASGPKRLRHERRMNKRNMQ